MYIVHKLNCERVTHTMTQCIRNYVYVIKDKKIEYLHFFGDTTDDRALTEIKFYLKK